MIKSYKKINKPLLFLTLGLLISLGPLTIYVYLPAFVEISQSLNVPIKKIQLTLTFYLIGIVIGQISYGPLFDRFGKKPPLIFGLSLFCISSLSCYFVNNVEQIIIFRLLQAIGGCACVVAIRAIIRDIYSPQKFARVFSYLILISGLAPIFSPFIGNIILKHFEWRTIFLFLLGYGLLCLTLTYFFVPETKGSNHNEKISHIFKKYYRILQDRNFVVNCLAGGAMMACLMSFMTNSAFLYLKYYQFTANDFAIIFSLNALGFVIFSQINNFYLKKISLEKLTNKLIFIPGGAGLILVLISFFTDNIYLISLLIFILISMCGVMNANSSALAMSKHIKQTGSASALVGTLQFLIASIFSFIPNFFEENSAQLVIVLIGSCGIICFIIRRFFSKKISRIKAIYRPQAIPLSQV